MTMRGISWRPTFLTGATTRARQALSCCLLFTAIYLLPPAYCRAAPRDDLLRLVPDDVGFCLVISDLRTHTDKLHDTPWIKAVRQSRLGQALVAAPELLKLAKIEERLQKQLQVGFTKIRDDILGDAVVFAYRPGPPGQPQQEQGLLLLWAKDSKLLSQLIDLLNKDQQESGEVKALEARVYKGVKYFRRAEAKEDRFYLQSGSLLAYTGQEEMLQRVIDLHLKKAPERTSPAGQQLLRLGLSKALAVLWINPRAFDANLNDKIKNATGQEAAFLETFRTYWKALEGIALALEVRPHLAVQLALAAKTEKLPEAARRFCREAAKPSEVWDRFPKNALLTMGGRVDASALAEALGEFMTPPARKAFADMVGRAGRAMGLEDVGKEILPYLGPDWGVCITAPQDKTAMPQVIAALRIRPGPNKVPVEQSLLKALEMASMLAVWNDSELRLKTEVQGTVKVRYLSHPKASALGYQPAFAFKEGYLVLASSPSAVQQFAAAKTGSELQSLPEGGSSDEVPLFRLSLRELSKLLKNRREAVVDALTQINSLPRKTAGELLDAFLDGLDLFEGVEVDQRSSPGQVAWTLRLRTAKPAK
jgi:hypothetical protein